MKNKKITIIDYGSGNLLSLIRAINAIGYNCELTNKKSKIKDASYLILPGDGAFGYATNKIKKIGLFDEIINYSKLGKPLLGICLGMQLLLSKSEEFGSYKGLSLIKGKNIKIKNTNSLTYKTPVIGWRQSMNYDQNFKDNKTFNKKKFYFIHSFRAVTKEKKDTQAYYINGKTEVASIIRKDNTVGCQFHPEKSGQVGLKYLDKFLNLK